MEQRWFQIAEAGPIAEGDLTLLVAKKLAKILQDFGAQVYLVREDSQPMTALRPESLRAVAKEYLKRGKMLPMGELAFSKEEDEDQKIRKASEIFFYRVGEIRARARWINETVKPDLTICLHFDAENWRDPKNPRVALFNHFHLLVNGAYTAEELAFDDIRFEMWVKLFNGSHWPERALSKKVSEAFARVTGLPPTYFPGLFAKKIGPNPFVWARNLLANRLYQSPVLYLEPYVMNHPDVIARIQAGDYEGFRRVGGRLRPSLYHEYATAVAQGLVDYYKTEL